MMQHRQDVIKPLISNAYLARVRFLRALPLTLGALAVLLGTCVIAAWIFDIESLKAPIPGRVAMKANTALGFILCGAALMLTARNSRAVRALSAGFALAAIALGSATAAQDLLSISFGVDALLIDTDADITGTIRGRMSPNTAFSFVLTGCAMLAGLAGKSLWRKVATGLACVVLALAFVNIVGYLYEAPFLYLDGATIESVAIHTAFGFVVLSLGCLAAYPIPALGELVSQESMAGANYRTLLPASILVPVAIGAAALVGYGSVYGAQGAVALTAVGSSVAIGSLVTVTHLLLSRSEQNLRLEDRALDSIQSGVVITNHRLADEPIVYVNPAFTAITGYEPEEIYGRNCRLLNEGVENTDQVLEELRDAVSDGRSCQVDILNRRKNGEHFWNRMSLAPVFDGAGMVSHFVGFIDDITGEQEREQRLQDTLLDLHRTTTAMDSFVRIMSHELRGPLNAAATWVSVIEMDASPDVLAQGVAAIRQSVDDQTRLISDLVDGTRAASPSLELAFEPVDLLEVLAFIVEEWKPRILENEQELSDDLAGPACVINGDPTRLRQIFGNLLSNASKYTPAGGRIEITLRRTDDTVDVSVIDSGNGIGEDQLDHVFDPYWRGSKTVKGLGLGLAIVRSLVVGHGGTISVASDGAGRGACFTVSLPLAAGSG